MNRQYYRADIDGLRALAVLLVAFFHADFFLFSGGFIGVDVFFVISGFLITQLIQQQHLKNTFSFANFYTRRARRLLPALFTVYALCLVASFMLLTPEHFERFGKELISSVFSVSNIYFWKTADYFDVESVFKPLLHTWSLSVEEQFYLLWPALFIALLHKKKAWLAPGTIIFLGAGSLLLNHIFIDDASTIFYLIPFRVFEFCIGGLMVWIAPRQPKHTFWLEPLLLCGLGLILFAATSYSKDTVFPANNALIPCIGTALAIYAGQAKYSGILFRNRLFVYIGLVSYSFYLTHWPALIFYQYYIFRPTTPQELSIVLLGAFGLAAAIHHLIEQPCRKTNRFSTFSPKKVAVYCISAALIFTLLGGIIWKRHGFEKRVSMLTASSAYSRAMSLDSCTDGYGVCEKEESRHPVTFFMIGDSHTTAMKYLLGVLAVNQHAHMKVHTSLACLGLYHSGLDCQNEIDPLFEEFMASDIKNIVLVSNWSPLTHSYKFKDYGKLEGGFVLERMAYTLDKLKAAGKNVYVYGSMPLMHRSPDTCFRRPIVATCEEFMIPLNFDTQRWFNDELKKTVLKHGGKYMDFFEKLCDDTQCRVAYEGISLYGNRFHFSKEGIGGLMLLDKPTATFNDLFKK